MGIITNVMSIFFIAEFILIGSTSLIMANITGEGAFGVLFMGALVSVMLVIGLTKGELGE